MQRWIALFLLATPALVRADSYPTTEIVKYVVGCMADLGGETEENLYSCACRFDSISSKFVYGDYDSAVMFERYKDMPGKKGAMVRDNQEGVVLKARLKQAREEAEALCPRVIRIEREPPAERK